MHRAKGDRFVRANELPVRQCGHIAELGNHLKCLKGGEKHATCKILSVFCTIPNDP